MSRERWRITVGELGQQFDLDFWDGKLVYSGGAGVHHLCFGFIHSREISRTHYVLACGGCNFSIVIPKGIRAKEEILDFFVQKGFHQRGEETEVCLSCEGTGEIHHTEYKDVEEWVGNERKIVAKEITETNTCLDCRGIGILTEPFFALP